MAKPNTTTATATAAPVGLPATAQAILALPPAAPAPATQARNNNSLRYIGCMLHWVAPLPKGWPQHVLASGQHSQQLVQGAGAAGIPYGNYVALKGSVSRLRHMHKNGSVRVVAPAPAT